MESKNNNPLYSIHYKMQKKDILDFVNKLHDMQSEYIEAAVEASGFKEANAELKRIMELK
jgi:hypothetical protein